MRSPPIKENQLRINDQINVSRIRLIDEHGKQQGVVDTDKGLQLAEDAGLDLVEVAPSAEPPVCKIMDFGKYLYELAKKEKDQKKKQHVIHKKEIRLRPRTEEHDLMHKIRHARKFLEDGNRLKITIMFRGRELANKEFGYKLLERVQGELEDLAKIDKGPIEEGRNIVLFLAKK
jgi:translation initiation factor IF-3